MRQYFVPACICLMTLSGATGSDPIPSLENFTGSAKSDNKVVTQAAPAAVTGSAEPAHVDIPIDMTAADVARSKPRPGLANENDRAAARPASSDR